MTLWRDLHYAARFLRRSPGFTAAAVLTLALSVGANASVFSLADVTLFRELGVKDADRIVHVFERRADAQAYPLSYADYLDYRGARSFEAIAAHYPTSPMHVLFDGEPQSLTGAVVTSTYFDVLQLQPAAGRFFSAEEDTVPGRDALAVISDSLWARQYARDPAAVGRVIAINGHAFTIAGVMPRGFSGVHPRGIQTDIWIPTAMFATGYRFCNAFERSCTIVRLLGRLKPDVPVAQAQSEFDTIASQLAAAYPGTNRERRTRIVQARGLGYGPVSEERRQIVLFAAVVGVVLLIACANIAGLLLARTASRRREIAVRLALGAGRSRIVRQLMAESVLLALLGGGVGLLLAVWGNAVIDTLYAYDSAGRPLDFRVGMTAAVIAVTGLVTAASALLFGLAPALMASRADVIAVLKDEGPSGGRTRARVRQALVSAQVALSVMLLIGAGLLIHSLREIYKGPGFNPDGVLLVRLRPSLIDYSLEQSHAYQSRVIARLESLPGVISASPAAYMPLVGAGTRVTVQRRDAATPVETEAVGNNFGAHFFSTLGIAVLEGRDFAVSDRRGAQKVAIVNDVLAKQVWPEGNVAGRTVVLNGEPHVVVGVVRDAQYYAAGEAPRRQVFFSYWQSGPRDAFLKDSRTHVRVAGDARAMLPQIRRAIAAVDPAVPLSEDFALTDRLSFVYQPVRMARAIVTAFGTLALVLTVIGLYGVLSFTVTQRTREIGLRVALGAERRHVAALVLRDAVTMALAGIAIGVIAAIPSSRLLLTLLYGVGPADAPALITAPLLVLAVALLAAFIPARRAANVSPMTALRYE